MEWKRPSVAWLAIGAGAMTAGWSVLGAGIFIVGGLQFLREHRDHQYQRLTDASGIYWDELENVYREFNGQSFSTLEDLVGEAPWPDESPDEAARELAAFAECVYPEKRQGHGIEELSRAHSNFNSARRDIKKTINAWGKPLVSLPLAWFISSKVKKHHTDTVKLYWYLDEALAKRNRTEDPDFRSQRRLKRLFRRQWLKQLVDSR